MKASRLLIELSIAISLLLFASDCAFSTQPPPDCVFGCSICCSTNATPAGQAQNYAWIEIGDSMVGAANNGDACAAIEGWNNVGMEIVQRVDRGTTTVQTLTTDVDTCCDSSEGNSTGDVIVTPYPPTSEVITTDYHSTSHEDSLTCPNGSHDENETIVTATGILAVVDLVVEIKPNGKICERIEPDGDRGMEITWSLQGDLSGACKEPQLTGESVVISVPAQSISVTYNAEATPDGKSGNVSWNGIDDTWPYTVWDGYSEVIATVGQKTKRVLATPSVDDCLDGGDVTITGKTSLFECPCDCEVTPSICGGGGCGGGNPDGVSSSLGASFCPAPTTTNGGIVFYDYHRDESIRPFGSESPHAGDRIFKYVKLNGDFLRLYAGGEFQGVLKKGDPYYRTNDNIIAATLAIEPGTDYLDVDMGNMRYRFPEPVGTSPSFVRRITNLSTDETWNYFYNGPDLMLSKIETPDGDTILSYDGSDRLYQIAFADGTTEKFFFNSQGICRMEQWYSTTLLRYLTWTEDDSNRITQINKHSLSSPNGVVASANYSYESASVDWMTDYERYGENYTVTTPTGLTFRVEAPDGSVREAANSSSAAANVARRFLRDLNENLVHRMDTETHAVHEVVTETTDGLNHHTTYTYGFDIDADTDEQYLTLLHQVTQPAGNYTKYIYDATRVEKVAQYGSTGPAVSYVEYEYDEEDRVTRTFTSTLNSTERTYEDDILRFITDGEGRNTFFEYNGEDQLAGVGDGSATTTFEYDDDGRRVRTQSPTGIRTGYEYHGPTGKLLKVHNDVGSSSDYDTEYQYDNINFGENLTAVIDAENRKTGYEYDAWGRLTKENTYTGTGSYTLDDSITYTYDSTMGEYLDYKVDMKDQRTTYEYDAPGFIRSTTWFSDNGSTEWGSATYDYNTDGSLANVVTTGGDCICDGTLEYDYNSNGLLTDRDSPLGQGRIHYGYDAIYRQNQVQYPRYDGNPSYPITVGYGYDLANRLTWMSSQSFDNQDAEFYYNDANQLVGMEFDDFVFEVDYGYDSTTGRLISTDYDFTSGTDLSLDYEYNSDGLRTKDTNADGEQTLYQYDRLNRLTRETGNLTYGSEGCLELNGSQYVSIESGGILSNARSDAFAVDARVYLEEYPETEAVIFERGSSGNADWFKLFISASGYMRVDIETDDRDRNAQWGYLPPLKEWFHIAAVWDESTETIKLYYNGFLVKQTNTIGGELQSFSGNPLIGEGVNGKIDEVLVRNSAPTTFTIDANYTTPSNILALWHFNDGTGTEADDVGSGDLDGTVSSTWWTNANGDPKPAVYEKSYSYDKVGNRLKYLSFSRTGSPSAEEWTLSYNDLNQLTVRQKHTSLTSATITERWLYTYDDNGNLIEAKKEDGAGAQQEKWLYTWNPRDQLTKAERRTGTGSGTYAGKVEYRYCLSCDGAMTERIEYHTTVSTTIVKSWRFEYDGIHLLRVDERYDSNNSGSITEADSWRRLHENSHRPGSLSHLLAKKVYNYASSTTGTPSGSTDYFYAYDPVGNVVAISNGAGTRTYAFLQDAWGNELSVGAFTGDSWTAARSAGVWEHQTGKWIDGFTGLYYFHARWYSSQMGRFVGRDPDPISLRHYRFSAQKPSSCIDTNGLCSSAVHRDDTRNAAVDALSVWTGCANRFAGQIAQADMNVDISHPAGLFNQDDKEYYHCFNHFHWLGGAFDESKSNEMQTGRWARAYQCCDPNTLGELLHYRQDCWAHWGWAAIHPPGWDEFICEDDARRQSIYEQTRQLIETWGSRCCQLRQH